MSHITEPTLRGPPAGLAVEGRVVSSERISF